MVREVFVGSDWLVVSSDVKRLEAAEVADDFAETRRWTVANIHTRAAIWNNDGRTTKYWMF